MSDSLIAADWAPRICAAWHKSTEAIFETGRLIVEAKAALPHGAFTQMIAAELPFGDSTARRLMAIAADARLAERAHAHVLPPSWMTLYELTKLDDAALDRHIAEGTIRPDMERREIIGHIKKERRATREAELGARQQALPNRRYGVILEDPEWQFETWGEGGMDRAADNHYPTSPLQAIKARDVGSIAADDCALLLWATVPMLPEALEVVEARGFTYVTHFVWVKDKRGTGYWNRNRHELLILATRGNVPCPAMGTQFDSAIAARVGAHSEKPSFAYEIAEAYFPSLPKIELNARSRRDGWDAWGFEAPADESNHPENPESSTDTHIRRATAGSAEAGALTPATVPAAGAIEPASAVADSGDGVAEAIRAGYARNAPLSEIAEATGLTARAVQKRAKRMQLTSADRQRAAVAEANRRRGQPAGARQEEPAGARQEEQNIQKEGEPWAS